MMGRQSRQMAMVFVDMESLIAENHLLRKVERMVTFDFIYQHGTQTITLKEVEDFLGSDLVGLSPPCRSKLYIACSGFYKSQSAHMPLLFLSQSNPLRWASVLFWMQP